MNICVPWSEAHDAPEHLRLTLHGGQSLHKSGSAHGGRKNLRYTDEDILQLLRAGMSRNAIQRELGASEYRINNVYDFEMEATHG